MLLSLFATAAMAQSPPVIHPSSNGGNFQGSGWPTAGQPCWTNSNCKLWADQFMMESDDPSANFSITLSGPLTLNDIIHTHFMWGANDVVIDYQITAADVAAGSAIQVLNNMAAAIHQDTRLWNLPNGTTNLYGGGYANGALFGLITLQSPNWIVFDYDVRLAPLSIKYTVTGAGTEVITVYSGLYNGSPSTGGSAQNTAYIVPNSLDGNPGIVTDRCISAASGAIPCVPSIVPQRGSLISGWSVATVNSSLGRRSFGSIVPVIYSATAGSEALQWWIQGMKAGASGYGIRIGAGLYTVYGDSIPNDGTGCLDMGPGSINACNGFYVNGSVGMQASIGGGKFSGVIAHGLNSASAAWEYDNAATNEHWWDAFVSGSTWCLRAVADDMNSATCMIGATRSGTGGVAIDLNTPLLRVNGTAGITATKTVRNAANTGSCTLVFTKGLLTGGTC